MLAVSHGSPISWYSLFDPACIMPSNLVQSIGRESIFILFPKIMEFEGIHGCGIAW